MGNVHIVQVEHERAVTYYTMDGQDALTTGTITVMQGFEEHHSLYAALFSNDAASYRCNMRKVFERLIILSEMYEQRANELKQKYRATGNQLCELQINPKFAELKEQATLCRDDLSTCLAELYSTAQSIQRNNAFVQQQCAVLY